MTVEIMKLVEHIKKQMDLNPFVEGTRIKIIIDNNHIWIIIQVEQNHRWHDHYVTYISCKTNNEKEEYINIIKDKFKEVIIEKEK